MVCDKNPQKIKAMFDEISGYYDGVNNFISLGTHFIIKMIVIKGLKIQHEADILDLCCGTGDFTRIISILHPKVKVIGLDFSKNMIQLAKSKNPDKIFVQGDCTDLPFKDNEFDYVTMGFGLRNIENRQAAIFQVHRVLKTGGKFLHLDFGKHNKFSKVFDAIVTFMVEILNKNSNHYKYLLKSKETFPEPADLIKEFENAGFMLSDRHDFLFGVISAQVMKKL